MPSYTLRQHANGTFYIHWTEGRRSRRASTGTKKEAEAQTFLAHWILAERSDKADVASTLLVSELWGEYYKGQVEKNNVDTRPADTAWKNLEPHFGALKPADIEQKNADGLDKAEEYTAKRAAGLIGTRAAAPATIRHELALLKAAFNWCAKPKQKLLRPADLPLFDLPGNSDPRDRWLRTEEIQRLLDAAAKRRKGPRLSRCERFLWLALETGSRLTAILELTWDRVDFETNVIHYNVPGRRKTKKRRASVPISTALRGVLLRAYEERETDLVMDHGALSIWRAVQEVATDAKVADVSPHVLRHTAATLMLRRGVSIWNVAGILALTAETVQKVYGHHCPEGLAEAVELISGNTLEAAE